MKSIILAYLGQIYDLLFHTNGKSNYFISSQTKVYESWNSIEISSTKCKNIILNTIYRPPDGDMKQCDTHFKNLFSKNGKNLKNIVLSEDLNINFLDFETNKRV